MDNFKSVSTDFFTKFNDLTYYDEPHKYYLKGKELISVTTLIHQYQEEFNEKYWADIKASHYGISPEEVIRGWRFINRKGTMKGSIIHDYAENLLLNKVFKYPKDEIINEFGFDPIEKEYLITKKHVNKFVDDSRGKLIPLKTELVMYDEESLIGGMADILFYNVKAKEIQIWDHKTNKAFTTSNSRKLNGCLYILDDCDLEIYSVQLALYKAILERNTDIKLGKSYVIWYSHKNPSYEVIEMKNRDFLANQILLERINFLKAS